MHHPTQHHPNTLFHNSSRASFHIDRGTLRALLTIFMYVGVILFLYPYAISHMSTGVYFLICGAVLTLTCGAFRCYLTDRDCIDRSRQK